MEHKYKKKRKEKKITKPLVDKRTKISINRMLKELKYKTIPEYAHTKDNESIT